MRKMTTLDVAKAVVRRNTEEVQGKGTSTCLRNSSQMTSLTIHRRRTRLRTSRVYAISTVIFVPRSLMALESAN